MVRRKRHSWSLRTRVVAKGVKEISGDVIGDDSYFPRERYPNGWEIDDMVWEYGAAISAIVVDDNTVALTLTPGEQAGNPVQGTVTPATPDFTVENEVITSAADVKPDLTLTREPGANVVVVKGSLPAKSAPRKLVLAIEEPAQHAAATLKRLLEERGIKVDGVAKVRHAQEGTAGDPAVLAEHVSVPLGDAAKLINKISQNLHTEMLLRTVARQSGVWATPDELMKVPVDFYAAAGVAPGDVIQADASGLSRHDLVTPRAIATLLSFAQKQSWVQFLLCIAAGGGSRRHTGRPHEKLAGDGTDSREDGLGRTREDAFRICRDAGRAAVDLFVLEQQSGWEEPRSGGRFDGTLRGDDRGVQRDAAEARVEKQAPAVKSRMLHGERNHRHGVWQFAAARRRCGLRRGADPGASFGEARILCLQRRLRRRDGSGVPRRERSGRENRRSNRGFFQSREAQSLD